MPAEPVCLPLRKAFLEFGDPALVAQYREIMREAVPFPTIGPPYSMLDAWKHETFGTPLPQDPYLVAMFARQQARYDAVMQRRQKAWQALEPGFRKQVASGELVLEGLQCAPILATARSVIPSLWARLLVFNTASDMVSTTVQNLEFMDVTVRLAGRQLSAEASAALPDDPPEATAALPLRPRGRTSYEPLIEAALRANWVEVQRRAANRPGQRPVWTEVARLLHKWLGKEHRSGGRQIPHEQTIRTDLPRIYERLLSEKPVRK